MLIDLQTAWKFMSIMVSLKEAPITWHIVRLPVIKAGKSRRDLSSTTRAMVGHIVDVTLARMAKKLIPELVSDGNKSDAVER